MKFDRRAFAVLLCVSAISNSASAGQVLGFTRTQGPDLAFADAPPGYFTSFQHAVAGDFNGDGTMDLAGAFLQYAQVGAPRFGRIRIAYGPFSQGARTPAAISLATANGASYIAAQDLNADGDADLVAFTNIGQGVGFEVGVILTDGAGGFLPRVDHHLSNAFGGSAPTRPSLADFDGDGDIDIVVAADDFYLLRNDGFGAMTVSNVGTVDSAARPRGLRAADFDGDGRVDLVSTTEAVPKSIVFQQQLNGTFIAVTNWAAYAWEPHTMDGDADGDPDVFTGGGWYRNDGALSFVLANQVQPVTGAHKMLVADLDGDGAPDVVNNPAWVFPAPPSPCCTIVWRGVPGSLATEPGSNVFAFKMNYFGDAADMDGDGTQEIIEYSENSGNGITSVLKASMRANGLPTMSPFLPANVTITSSGVRIISLDGTDADLQALSWRIATPPTKGTASITQTNILNDINASASLRYDPDDDATGTDTVTVVANDGVADSTPHTFTITLNFAPPGSGGGGGSGGLIEMFALLIAAFACRRRSR